jgi:hypothetical protein
MDIGPVEILVVGFPGNQFTGEIDYVALAVGDGAAAVSRAGATIP